MNLIRFNHHPFYPGWINENDRYFCKENAENRGEVPAVNIKEADNSFIIELAAPGLKKDHFKINVEKNVLSISSEFQVENKEKTENYTRKEFSYDNFCRSFKISDNILVDDINANYEDGILKVQLPKKNEVKLSREIKIA